MKKEKNNKILYEEIELDLSTEMYQNLINFYHKRCPQEEKNRRMIEWSISNILTWMVKNQSKNEE